MRKYNILRVCIFVHSVYILYIMCFYDNMISSELLSYVPAGDAGRYYYEAVPGMGARKPADQ